MKTVEILCDNCGANITTTGKMPRFRLVLSCEQIPHDADTIYLVRVTPPIAQDKHFCCIACLEGWVTSTKEPASVLTRLEVVRDDAERA
jgi:hypothetical protein